MASLHLPSGPPWSSSLCWHPRVPRAHTDWLLSWTFPPNPGRILRSHLKSHFLRGHLNLTSPSAHGSARLPGAGQRCGLSSLAPSLPDLNLHLNKPQVCRRHPEVPGLGRGISCIFSIPQEERSVLPSLLPTRLVLDLPMLARADRGRAPMGPLCSDLRASLSPGPEALKPQPSPLCAGGHPYPSSLTCSPHLPPWRGVRAAPPPLETGQRH